MCIAAGIVGSLAGGAIASSGAKSAARTAARGDQAAIDEQRRQFDITQQNFAPYQQIGTGALNQLAALYGIPQYTPTNSQPSGQYGSPNWLPGTQFGGIFSGANGALQQMGQGKIANNSLPTDIPGHGQTQPIAGESVPAGQSGVPNFASFYNSPDYQFNLSEGLKAVENSAAARGGLYSGNALRALQERGAGIASQQYGNYTNRLAALAGIGQTATGQLAGYGAQSAGNIGNLLSNQGNARASGIAGSANAWGGALGTLASMGQNYFANRTPLNYVAPDWSGSYLGR